MTLPSPGVLDHLIRDRQETLRQTPMQAHALSRAALRVRLGHALIVAGSTISGERVELPARPSMTPHTA